MSSVNQHKSNTSLLNVISTDQVQIEAIDWLQNGVLARGKVTLLAGDGDTGKSQITANQAAVISSVRKFPLTEEVCSMWKALILPAKDDPAIYSLRKD